MRHLRLLVWRRSRNDLWNNTYVHMLHILGQCCVQVWTSTCEQRWTPSSQPTPMEIGVVISTCASCGKAGHETSKCRFRNAEVQQICQDSTSQSDAQTRGEICWASQVPRAAVARVLATAARAVETCYCCGTSR